MQSDDKVGWLTRESGDKVDCLVRKVVTRFVGLYVVVTKLVG